MSDNAYSEDSIVALKPMEHIRRRPQMYIGGTDSRAMHWLINEAMHDMLTSALAGTVSHISVTLEDRHRVTMSDDGAGIPEEDRYGRKLLEIVMAQSHSPLATVNALSSQFEATTKCDGWVRNQRFQRGIPDAPETKIRQMTDGESTGTSISFVPDFEIFEAGEFNFWTLAQSLREQAYLIKGLKITLEDKRPAFEPQLMSFCFPEGLKTYLEHLDDGKWYWGRKPSVTNVVFSENFEVETPRWSNTKGYLEVGIKFLGSGSPLSTDIFANNLKADDRGVETDAFIEAARNFFVKHWVTLSPNPDEKPVRKPRITKQKATRGLFVVFNIQHPDPFFESNSRMVLLNRDLYPIMYAATTRMLTSMMDTHRGVLEDIARRL